MNKVWYEAFPWDEYQLGQWRDSVLRVGNRIWYCTLCNWSLDAGHNTGVVKPQHLKKIYKHYEKTHEEVLAMSILIK